MKCFRCGDDLKDVGIDLLTGEACGLAMRVLCNLNEEGVKLWETFTRSTCDTKNAWNDGHASVMIPHSMFRDLWIFGQVMKGVRYVFIGGYVFGKEWVTKEYTVGYGQWYTSDRSGGSMCDPDEPIKETTRVPGENWQPEAWAVETDEDMQKLREAMASGYFYIRRTFTKSTHPGTGLDNRHAMSGRTV
jgi:hypothetical protein